jgi:hypothetical protein
MYENLHMYMKFQKKYLLQKLKYEDLCMLKLTHQKFGKTQLTRPCHHENSHLTPSFSRTIKTWQNTKKQKFNANAKSIDTGVESDSPGDVEITTNSADAGSANINVASGGIDPVVESTTTNNNACNTIVDAINTSRNGNGSMEATAATGNHDNDSANTTGIMNNANTTETSVAGVADAVVNDVVANNIVNNVINKDGHGPVDALVQVSVHMHTLFYKYQILSYLTTNYSKPENFDTHAIKYSGITNYNCKMITLLI